MKDLRDSEYMWRSLKKKVIFHKNQPAATLFVQLTLGFLNCICAVNRFILV